MKFARAVLTVDNGKIVGASGRRWPNGCSYLWKERSGLSGIWKWEKSTAVTAEESNSVITSRFRVLGHETV